MDYGLRMPNSPSVLLASELGGVLPEGSNRGDAALVIDVHPERPVPGGLLYPQDPHPAPRPALDHDHRDGAGVLRLLHEHGDVEPGAGVERALRHQEVQELVPGQLLVAGPAGGQPDLTHGPGRGADRPPARPHAVVHRGQEAGHLGGGVAGGGEGRPPVAGQGQLRQTRARVPGARAAHAYKQSVIIIIVIIIIIIIIIVIIIIIIIIIMHTPTHTDCNQ